MRTILALLLAAVLPVGAQDAAPGNDSILADELRADLFFLASDEMQGRLTETSENALAAAFIRSRFQRLGLEPMGAAESFDHRFRLVKSSLGDDNELELLRDDGTTMRAQLGEGFFPLRFSPSGTAEGEIVFAGYGIHAPKLSHDDYQGVPLSGKIVIVLEHEPAERDPESVFNGVVTSEYSRDLRKVVYAQDAGAAGVLFVTDVHNHPDEANFSDIAAGYWPESPRRVPRYTLARWAERVRVPVLRVSPVLAEAIVHNTGRTLRELAGAAEASGGIQPIPLPRLRLRMTAGVGRVIVTDRNVLAAIEGSDPTLRDEWVVVGAHYDHEGADGDRVFNGADDDGSGTVALLEIAEAYALAARGGQRPRRSVMFAAWNSEERGLLGAWAYAENPTVPLARTAAVLNMDMIGRNEEVRVGGGGRFRGLELQTAESNANAINIMGYTYSADLKTGVEEANRGVELELKLRYDNNASNLLRRSDQWPFLQMGVPSLFFHTGLHPDYHTEFDVPERIEYDKLQRIARLVHQLSWNLANAPTKPSFDRLDDAAALP
jgi:hypothetical protein